MKILAQVKQLLISKDFEFAYSPKKYERVLWKYNFQVGTVINPDYSDSKSVVRILPNAGKGLNPYKHDDYITLPLFNKNLYPLPFILHSTR